MAMKLRACVAMCMAAAVILFAPRLAVSQPTGGFADLDAATGAVLPTHPEVDGEVYSIARHPTDGWILGGSFISVGGQPRLNLAHVRADGTVAAWNPGTNGPVYAVHASSVEVFVGGSFTVLGGENRTNLGKLNPNTGVVANWTPNPDGVVRALVQVSSTLFVGGGFLNFAAQPRMCLAALNMGTGVLSAWNPGADDTVFTMDLRIDP